MHLASKPLQKDGSCAQASMRGPRFSVDLDRAPCSEASPKTVPMRKPLCAVLYAPPMRGTRSLIEINRGPCFETTTKRGTLCAPPVREHDFTDPPSSLIPPSSPSSLLLLSAKSYAPDYARCRFDGSGLPAPPSSFLPPLSSSSPLPPPSASQTLCATLCAL